MFSVLSSSYFTFLCDYKAIISISYFKWGMHVTKCYYRTHSEFIDFMLSSPNDVSLYLILYYSLVFTSPLPFQTLTCYPHTAAVIGQCPFCKRTHSTSPTKNYNSTLRKHSILPSKDPNISQTSWCLHESSSFSPLSAILGTWAWT